MLQTTTSLPVNFQSFRPGQALWYYGSAVGGLRQYSLFVGAQQRLYLQEVGNSSNNGTSAVFTGVSMPVDLQALNDFGMPTTSLTPATLSVFSWVRTSGPDDFVGNVTTELWMLSTVHCKEGMSQMTH